MDVDLAGMIRNARSRGPALLPVFEAIMNSIHAADERGVPAEVTVVLHRAGQVVDDGDGPMTPIDSVTIVDNGVGFNDANFKSFDRLFTSHKASKGGKGLGRVRFLERFTSVEISSSFRENGNWYTRSFSFKPTVPPVSPAAPVETDDPKWETRVKLKNLRPTFAADFPKRHETIARKIVEHFFEKFIGDQPPTIMVLDESSGERLDTRDVFATEYATDLHLSDVALKGWTFRFSGVWVGKDTATTHEAVFCADDRAVTFERLATHEPILSTVAGQHGHPMYRAYISGSLLNEHVDHERTSFTLDREGELPYFPDKPTWNEVVGAVMGEARIVLGDYIETTRQRNDETNRAFIGQHHPEFRSLLTYRGEALSKIPHNAGIDRRYAEMQRIRTDWRIELNQKACVAMSAGTTDAYKALVEELTDSAASDLAQYVVHRRWVLNLLEKCLQLGPDGRYARESEPHDILWPRHTGSNDDVWYEPSNPTNLKRHNLWLLDERLAFHHYLASDTEFRSLPDGLGLPDDRDRADILVYDVPTAFVETSDEDISAVTVVELKRPERPDSDDPIQQALDYVEKIRTGSATNPITGQRYRVSPSTRYFCYILATLNDAMDRFARLASLVKAPDGLGYFGFNANFQAYIEVIDWQKLLRDAKKRNRAWFDVAGLK